MSFDAYVDMKLDYRRGYFSIDRGYDSLGESLV